jgi:hypothetical protein
MSVPGEFIAIATLVTKTIQALHTTQGSKAEFESILQTLISFNYTLKEAEDISLQAYLKTDGKTIQESTLHGELAICAEHVRRETTKCQRLISAFYESFKSVTAALSNTNASALRQTIYELKWPVQYKRQADMFQKELKSHLDALQAHLIRYYTYVACYHES